MHICTIPESVEIWLPNDALPFKIVGGCLLNRGQNLFPKIFSIHNLIRTWLMTGCMVKLGSVRL